MGGFWLGLLLGLGLGLGLLLLYRSRYDAKLKALLQRISIQSASPVMPYESQIASAIATQTSAVESLSAQVEDFRQILALAPIGYLYVDEENQLLWCNRQARQLLDIEQTDFSPPRLLLAVVRSYELDQLVEQTRQCQALCQQDWTFRSISPDPSNVSERPAYPLRGSGVPLRKGHVGVFLENRQEAIMLIQQRDRWTSDVAHELKTPLTSIRLVSETLRSRIDPSLTRWVDRLLNEVTRLSVLVDDLLKLSHLDQRERIEQSSEETDLVGLLHQAWQSLEPLAQLKQLQFTYEGPPALAADIDAGLIYRAFFNLLDNAIKYSPTAGTIIAKIGYSDEPALAATPPHLLIEIIDRGPGFAAKDLPHIFDRFYRADPARTKERSAHLLTAEPISSGTGLGLAIVQRIVASHQGCVQGQNHPETQGGWLKIWLPGKRVRSTESTDL
ncbi:MAG: sensor histidine kinase [Leptolyngbya sp. SIO4C1]|nr:sensor histidine kinase [Leptolyngbya sp. SIO4C1]